MRPTAAEMERAAYADGRVEEAAAWAAADRRHIYDNPDTDRLHEVQLARRFPPAAHPPQSEHAAVDSEGGEV